MQSSQQFNKLTKAAKSILINFEKNGNKSKLFKGILEDIDTQQTQASKQVRRSQFRGLLRKYFDFSDNNMRRIEPTVEEKQLYHDTLKQNFEMKHVENVVSLELFNELLNVNDLSFLLLTSGRRVNEILNGEVQFDDNKREVQIKLSKKRGEQLFPIYLLCSYTDWKDRYQVFKARNVANDALYLNRNLKHIIPEKFYKRSTHFLRAIYVRFIYEFRNPARKPLTLVISKYINHENSKSSAHYQYVVFDDTMCDVWSEPSINFNAMTVPKLKALCKQRGLTGYSKLTKDKLIEMLKLSK